MDRHLFFDGALHAFETDAKLIFEQFANGADAAIAQMINVVRLINRPLFVIDRVASHLQDVRDNLEEVPRRQQGIFNALHFRLAHFDVEFQPSDARKIEFTRIEEHPFKQPICSLHGRRITGSHLAINFEERIDGLADRVLLEGLRNYHADIVYFREEHVEALDAIFNYFL